MTRRRWVKALRAFQARHPAARDLLVWAKSETPRPVRVDGDPSPPAA